MTTARPSWHPSLSMFLRRTVLVGAITLALMALAGWVIGALTGLWQVLYAGPVLALAYNILFEDPLRWRRIRQDRWSLDETAITYHSPDGDSMIPLADITQVRVKPGWTVVIYLKGGMRVRMAYIARPRAVAQRILDARDGLTP